MGANIKYSYRHSPTLWAFAQCDSFIRGLMGPFRSGKSSACVVEILRRAQMQKPGADGIRRTRWQVVRNTSGELRDTTIKTFFMWAPEGIFGTFNQTNMDYHITGIEGCDIWVHFRALDRPDHVKKLLSLELTGCWFNEAREIPWSIIHTMRGRVRQYPSREMGGCTWGGIIMDTNPPDTESRWYKFFEEEVYDESYRKIFKQPSGLADNAENIPFINGGRQYYVDLCKGADQDYIKVYIGGQYGFTKWGKPVFDEYNDALHCMEMDPVPGLPVRRSFDWGLTPACVFTQLLPDQRYLVFDEMTSDDMSVEDFMDDVADYSSRSFKKRPLFIDTGDPAGEIRSETDKRSCFMIAAAKGFDVSPGIQSLLVRIASVRKPLRRLIGSPARPQLILHPRCKLLRRGFLGGYHYRQKKTFHEQFEEKPFKNEYSHPMDALQYDCTKIFGTEVLTGLDNAQMQAIHEQDDIVNDATRNRHTGY